MTEFNHREEVMEALQRGGTKLATYTHPIWDLNDRGNRTPLAWEFLSRYETTDGVIHSVGSLFEEREWQGTPRLMLDFFCLEATFAFLRAWDPTKEPPRFFFVNMDPQVLELDLLWDNLPYWIDRLPFHASKLVIEITEQYLTDLPRMKDLVTRLRSFQVKIAVDDLGSAAASLTALAMLEPNFLKIDHSLVANVALGSEGNHIQSALLRALSSFARETGMGLVAEGIETEDEAVAVRQLGIPYGQGFYFGKPRPAKWTEEGFLDLSMEIEDTDL